MASQTELVEKWRGMLASYNDIAGRLDRELSREHGLSASEFDTLERLVTCGDGECRMQLLADNMYLSQSALSRAVDRLERQGLVERTHCSDDRRGIFVVVTDDGMRRYEEARETWLGVLADHL